MSATKIYRVFRWESGRSYFVFETEEDPASIFELLSSKDDEVLLKDFNFKPVTNFNHFSSLGILDDDVDATILSEPAHFNPVFYYLEKL